MNELEYLFQVCTCFALGVVVSPRSTLFVHLVPILLVAGGALSVSVGRNTVGVTMVVIGLILVLMNRVTNIR